MVEIAFPDGWPETDVPERFVLWAWESCWRWDEEGKVWVRRARRVFMEDWQDIEPAERRG